MTLPALPAANIRDHNRVYLAGLKGINKCGIICFVIFVGKIDGRFIMAIDTPSHGQVFRLFNNMHVFYLPMAGNTFYLTNAYMLHVVEIGEIRQIMDAYPPDRNAVFGSLTDLPDLEKACTCTLLYMFMAIHTEADRWDPGIFAFQYPGMTEIAIDLIIRRMYGMRKFDRLYRSIML